MPATQDDPNAAAMQAMFQAGQSFAQGFMHFLAGQQAAMQAAAAHSQSPAGIAPEAWGPETA